MGKQDMSGDHAKKWAETFEDTTEDGAREKWDEDVTEMLSTLLCRITGEIGIFPLKCPKCYSLKITVSLGTADRLDCLSCGSKFKIVDDVI